MKKIHYIIIYCLLFTFACKEDRLELYKSPESIYFPGEIISSVYQPKDSTFFSFGYTSDFIQDTLLKIPVATTGARVGYDRTYAMQVLTSSTLEEGNDFEFENQVYSIKSGRLQDTIRIRLKRSKALRERARKLDIVLLANADFAVQMKSQIVGTGAKAQLRYFDRFTLVADDVVGAPWFWDLSRNKAATTTIGYLGDYSQKKFQLLIGYFKLDVAEITKEVMPGNYLVPWAYGLQSYLNDMAAKGSPVLEDNGTPMKMGKNVQ
jgi:hypothetical protein